MRVIGKLKLQSFWQHHHQARTPLEKWIQVVEQAQWDNWANVKSTFGTADLVKTKTRDYVVFNIGGNKYRLILAMDYGRQASYVKFVGTHRQYDAIDAETV